MGPVNEPQNQHPRPKFISTPFLTLIIDDCIAGTLGDTSSYLSIPTKPTSDYFLLPSAAAAFSGSDWLQHPTGPQYPGRPGWGWGRTRPKLPPYRSWGTWTCRRHSHHRTGCGWGCGTCHRRCCRRWRGPWLLRRPRSRVSPRTQTHRGPGGTGGRELFMHRGWIDGLS